MTLRASFIFGGQQSPPMTNRDADELIARVRQLPDGEILKALASLKDYGPEARIIYEAEGQRRGIQPNLVAFAASAETQRRKDKQAATWSLKGIGERLYGKRDFRADHSYQTTKWFILLYLPIYPLATLRVRESDNGQMTVLEELPTDWRQVLDTYSFVVISWWVIVTARGLCAEHPFPGNELLTLALLALPFLFIYIVRRRARRAAGITI